MKTQKRTINTKINKRKNRKGKRESPGEQIEAGRMKIKEGSEQILERNERRD